MKKSILITGKQDSGKSTTIKEVCKKLNPSKVSKLDTDNKTMQIVNINDIYNDTYILEVNGKNILVVAGAPTEQKKTLTVIIEICIKINIEISFLLVSKRSYERRIDFDTKVDINNFSQLILEEKISQIPLVDPNDIHSFMQDQIFINRIDKIHQLVQSNI